MIWCYNKHHTECWHKDSAPLVMTTWECVMWSVSRYYGCYSDPSRQTQLGAAAAALGSRPVSSLWLCNLRCETGPHWDLRPGLVAARPGPDTLSRQEAGSGGGVMSVSVVTLWWAEYVHCIHIQCDVVKVKHLLTYQLIALYTGNIICNLAFTKMWFAMLQQIIKINNLL